MNMCTLTLISAHFTFAMLSTFSFSLLLMQLQLYLSADNAAFDASQYAFFGKGIVEEVELGGLEDEIDNDTGSGGPADEEYHFSSFGNREEVRSFILHNAD